MKTFLILICALLVITTNSFSGITKAERLKQRYNEDAEFHVVVDLIFDIASKVDKKTIDDAIYLFKEVDKAMLLIGSPEELDE